MTKGKDLSNGLIEVEGMRFDDRLRVSGALYIESKTGKSFLELAEELGKTNPSISTVATVITALFLQCNGEVDAEQAEQTIGRLDFPQMMAVFGKLKLEFEEKNSEKPETDLTEAAPAKK